MKWFVARLGADGHASFLGADGQWKYSSKSSLWSSADKSQAEKRRKGALLAPTGTTTLVEEEWVREQLIANALLGIEDGPVLRPILFPLLDTATIPVGPPPVTPFFFKKPKRR